MNPQNKKALLDKYGVDSTKFWLNDNGEVIPMEQDNSFMAGVKSAAINLPRTVTGFMGGAAGAAGAGALGLPSGPGAIATGIAGAFAGGAAGSALGDKLQNAVYPEEWLLGQEARQVRNPKASMVGEIAPSFLAMRPSIPVMRDAARGIGSLVRGGAQFGMRPKEAGALGNILMGGALQGGGALGQGASAQEVLAQTLLGALQHQPTKLGTKLSFDTFQPHVGDVTLRDAVNPADLRAPAPVEAPVTQSPTVDALRDSLLKQQQNKYTKAFEENIAKMAANDAASVRQQTVQAAMSQLDPTGRPVEQPVVTPRTSQFSPEPPVRKVEDLPLDAQGRPSYKISGEQPFDGQQIPLEPTGAFERGVPTQPGKPAPRSDIPRDLRSMDERVESARPVDGTPADRREPFAPAPKPRQAAPAQPGQPGYQDQQLNLRPTQAYNDWYARDMAQLDNVIVKFGTPTNEAGAPVAGVTMPTRDAQTGTREIGISERAYTDTLPHERTHGLILDVLQHGKAGEKAKMRRLLEQAGVPEEALVQGVGEDVVKRFLDGTTDKWRDDFGAFMRTKFGRGTKESLQNDARRVLGSIMYRGGGSSKVLRGYKPTGVVQREVAREEEVKAEIPESREPEMTQPSDDNYQLPPNKPIEYKQPEYQEFNDKDRAFATDFEKELSNPRPFKVQVAGDGRMSAKDVMVAVGKLNPTEQQLLKEGGLSEFLRVKVRPNAAELKAWAAENLPQVEVKELSADAANKAVNSELGGLQHNWYDNLSTQQRRVADAMIAGDDVPNSEITSNFRDEDRVTLSRYVELSLRAEGTITDVGGFDNDSATAAYDIHNINPRQLKNMPGAVDLLVRLPRRELGRYKNTKDEFDNYKGGPADRVDNPDGTRSLVDKKLYSSNHYPKSGDNLLAQVRAYEHAMPDGERVLRVFELQSDWAQDRRKMLADRTRQGDDGKWYYSQPDGHSRNFKTREEMLDYINNSGFGTKDHTLLPHHQRLALKAAIEHARKRGIKRVVVDDAETAMMTEGHDKFPQRKVLATPENIEAINNIPGKYGLERVRITNMLRRGEEHLPGSNHEVELLKQYGVAFGEPTVRQEKGMRQAYESSPMVRDAEGEIIRQGFESNDDAQAYVRGFRQESAMRRGEISVSRGQLHEMMRDLSGDGVKIEMGEHRNAVSELRQAPHDANNPERFRDNLIFRNPDGTPKTQSTGVAYDTSAAQARRGAGEPFSYAGRRYQEFGPNVPDKTYGKTPAAEDRISLSPFESASQAAARSKNPTVRYVGSRLAELFPAQRAMQGKYRALPEAFAGLKEKESDALIRHLIEEDRAGVARPIASNLKTAYDNVRATLKQMRADQIAAGQPRNDGSTPGTDPSYMFNIPDPSVRKTLRDETGSARYNHLRDSFIDFNKNLLMRKKGMNAADAQKKSEEFFQRYEGTISKQPVDKAFDFGSVSLPAGSKLPDNWLHSNPAEAARQYVRDWSRARTFHDTIRTDEQAMAALGQENYYKNGKLVPVTAKSDKVAPNENIRHLLNEALGVNVGSQDKVTGAVGRFASTLWLANPITRSVDIATSAFKALGYVRPQHIPGLVANLQSFGKSIRNAHDTGWVREDGNAIVGEVLGAGEAFSNWIDKLSKKITKFTGSEALENFGRSLAQNTGEYIARTNKALAQSGDKRAVEFLDRVAPNWKTLSEAELGTRIGQLFQGRYDATNLPKWLSDSPVAPFMSLSRWNIEQWNNFREMAIKPARKGDITPLVSMMIAGALGGVGVKEIREALGGRKSKIATIKELQEAPEGSAKYQEAVRYLGNLMQLTGTMGIVSEGAAMALDAAAKDRPQSPTMPAYEVVTDLIPRGIAAANAMLDGEDPLAVLAALSRDIGNEHVSFYRFMETNAGRMGLLESVGEDVKDAAARRDLRVGKRLRGDPVRVAMDMPIDYSRAEERAMERERDPAKMKMAANELKSKIRAIPDKDERARKLRSASSSRVSYMPSRANDPKAYREQMDFVRRTQGEAKADELRRRYLRDTKNSDWRRAKFAQ